MRLKNVFISNYKNLKSFSLSFEGDGFIDIFVGKNGSGKSNLLEALIEIFRHIIEFDSNRPELAFNYAISYEINGATTIIKWEKEALRINDKPRKTIGKTPRPDNILIYYSGHNETVGALVEQYENNFRKRIRQADFSESRDFIGIGPDYKALLLAVMLMQPEACSARKFICQKLSIEKIGLLKPGTKEPERTEPLIKLVLTRPEYAKKNKADYSIENNDADDRFWKPEGITKIFLDRLNNCITRSFGELIVAEGYISSDDQYILYLDINKLNEEFADHTPYDIFRQFDNLKTLGFLKEISVPLQLAGGVDASISHFSDGQFQSVYIYAITELFKDKHCITLLDEPDSFLHPEWQFDFLKQVFSISDEATKTNHVLMNSHSASTICAADESTINLFEFENDRVVTNKVKKSDVIKSLSAGLITFTEGEARLNIQHVLKNTTGPILFTEGITDEMILETAWNKLYPEEQQPFDVQNAFSCGFLRNLINDKNFYKKHPGRTFFSLFDFDVAHNDWKQLGVDIEENPHKCLTKKLNAHDSYAMLLPVPLAEPIRSQVINPHTGGNYGNKSLLTIEHLFYGVEGLEQYFIVDTSRTDNFIKFVSDSQKVPFAKEVVPTIDIQHFEVFRPLFEFIKSKCVEVKEAA